MIALYREMLRLRSRRKKRLLVVDDDEDCRDILTQFLRAQYDVVTARDGIEGLEKASSFRPDLIITDIAMPRLGGIAMVHHLRASAGLWVPVFFLSGLTAPDDVVKGSSAGARYYLTKPVQLSDLGQRLSRALGHR